MNIHRMINNFYDMVRIDSESGNEGAFHDYLKQKFSSLGLSVYEDNKKHLTKLGANNLIFTLEENAPGEPIFFSCHTDTVKPGVNIEPYEDQGTIYAKGDTILGADNKAGIAITIELIQHIIEENIPHPKLEFVFTPGEEIGLVGAQALDHNAIESTYGFVLDSHGPVGGITMASPTLMTLDVAIEGRAAHAGLEPEKGISAIFALSEIISLMPFGRLNENTTVNVGTIHGGVAANVVAQDAEFKAEIRSINMKEFVETRDSIVDLIHEVSQHHKTTADITEKILSQGYHYEKSHPLIGLVINALNAFNISPRYEVSGGGSDANVFNANGKQTLNLSIGYEEIHTSEEHIPIIEMERCVWLCLEIIERIVGGHHDLQTS